MGKQSSLVKRFTDIFCSLVALILTAPFMIVAGIAVKLDSKGPALFIHERTGYKGKNFKMFKFRGMINNALAHGPELTQVNDPRITKVGKFLRRTSLDELPQFINVLLGDMSLVGPRPEMTTITARYTEEQKAVFNFKPGITGISQVNGRQMLTPEKRVKMECEYYSKATFWTDLKIIGKTIKVVLNNSGNI